MSKLEDNMVNGFNDPQVWYGRLSDLPNFDLQPFLDQMFASYSGPDGGLTVVETESAQSDDESIWDSVDIAGAMNWNIKSRKAYGISLSLYDQHPVTKKLSGDPIADSFGICARKNNCLLVIADGVNWGEKSRLAARCAVYGCMKFVQQRLFKESGGGAPSTTREVLDLLLGSFDLAHKTILKHNGGLTTLCASLVCPIRGAKHYAMCTVNVGDSLAFVFSRKHGVREITVGSHDIDSERDIRDAGGALGPVNGQKPELNNLTLSLTIVERGDVVFLTTDGVSDNFDPVVGKIALAVPRPEQRVDAHKQSASTPDQPVQNGADSSPEINANSRKHSTAEESPVIVQTTVPVHQTPKPIEIQSFQSSPASGIKKIHHLRPTHLPTKALLCEDVGPCDIGVCRVVPDTKTVKLSPTQSTVQVVPSRLPPSPSSRPTSPIDTAEVRVRVRPERTKGRRESGHANSRVFSPPSPIIVESTVSNPTSPQSQEPLPKPVKPRPLSVSQSPKHLPRVLSNSHQSSQQQSGTPNGQPAKRQKEHQLSLGTRLWRFTKSASLSSPRLSKPKGAPPPPVKLLTQTPTEKAILTPAERHRFAVKQMEKVLLEFELNTEMNISAQELCGILIQHCLTLTQSKRNVLENPELYERKKMKARERKERDADVSRRMALAAGKLDHATICAYQVGLYAGIQDEQDRVQRNSGAPPDELAMTRSESTDSGVVLALRARKGSAPSDL